MSQRTIYGPGGFTPTEPFGNALEQWDDPALVWLARHQTDTTA